MRSTLVLASTAILAACNFSAEAQHGERAAASGSGAQRSYQVGDFNAISLAGPHDVVVTVGPAISVRAEGNERDLEQLEIRNDGNRLWIGTKQGSNWPSRGDRAVTVHVTAPALAKAAIGGSGDMRIDTVQGGSFEGAIGGSGDMQIASLRVDSADFSVAGSGDIKAAGATRSAKVSIAGSGDIDISGIDSRQAEVSIMGSGEVRAKASETASVTIMGSGSATVGGGARCSVNKRGSGSVRCGSAG